MVVNLPMVLISGLIRGAGSRDDLRCEEARKAMIAVDRSVVLVIENDEAIRSTLLEGLQDAGLAVEAADAADASIDWWDGDVIVTDTFASPYCTEEVVAYLKRLRSRFAAGLVVLTAHAGAVVDAAQLPADAVVMKPYDLDDLIAVIAAVALSKRQRDGEERDRAAAS
jgi:DNA-binding NtrC family response regulator